MNQYDISFKYAPLSSRCRPLTGNALQTLNLTERIDNMRMFYTTNSPTSKSGPCRAYADPIIRHVLLKKTLFHLNTVKKNYIKLSDFHNKCHQSMGNIMCLGLSCTPIAKTKNKVIAMKTCRPTEQKRPKVPKLSITTKSTKFVNSKYTILKCPLDVVKKKRSTIFIRQPSDTRRSMEIEPLLRHTIDIRCTNECKKSIALGTNNSNVGLGIEELEGQYI